MMRGSSAPQKNCGPPPEFRITCRGGGKNYRMERLSRLIYPKFRGGIIDKCCPSPDSYRDEPAYRSGRFIYRSEME